VQVSRRITVGFARAGFPALFDFGMTWRLFNDKGATTVALMASLPTFFEQCGERIFLETHDVKSKMAIARIHDCDGGCL
jgi:hypothetical protein